MRRTLRLIQGLLLTALTFQVLASATICEAAPKERAAKDQAPSPIESLRHEIQELKGSIEQEQLVKIIRERDEVFLQHLSKSVDTIIKEQDTGSTVQAMVTLLAVIVGGSVTFLSSIVFQVWLQYRESINLRDAFVGEISALREIIKQRNYIGHLQQMIAHVQQSNQSMSFNIAITQEYFWVYKNNASRLGTLKHPFPQKIATFYTQCFSIVEDLKNTNVPPTPQQSLAALQELLRLFQDTLALGEEIVSHPA